jgi:hypothetical protein
MTEKPQLIYCRLDEDGSIATFTTQVGVGPIGAAAAQALVGALWPLNCQGISLELGARGVTLTSRHVMVAGQDTDVAQQELIELARRTVREVRG